VTPDIVLLLDALAFSAEKHRHQRRKGAAASPYINHPIEVTRVLTAEGGVRDVEVLMAAILHDTIEDTATTVDELTGLFGERVAALVAEVTDDKGLPAPERKRVQVERAALLTVGAKLIRVSDKICNVRDLLHDPPHGWSTERQRAYLDWSEQVVAQCRGVNAGLEDAYDRALAAGRQKLGAGL
jgi:GTP diphosphokinase / guanosine-3',5'-bis(diphosphate) 3'-diphosphatase